MLDGDENNIISKRLSKRERLLSFSTSLRPRPSSKRWDGYIDLDASMISRRALLPKISGLKQNPADEFKGNTSQDFPIHVAPPRILGSRLLDRDYPFRQSSGNLRVSHFAKGDVRTQVLALYSDDWFHVLLSVRTIKIFMLLMICVTFSYLFFAALYMLVDRTSQECRLGPVLGDGGDTQPLSLQAAFGFSLITSATIGYGFVGEGDTFYFRCKLFVLLVFLQSVFSLLFNAMVVGIILQRVSRANTRAHQVVFSDKAIIRNINNRLYFSVQVFDLDRRHPVVEAHIRMYAVFHPTPETYGRALQKPYETKVMRIQTPNDELGGVLFLSVPCIAVHHIDAFSPLKAQSQADESSFLTAVGHRLVLREVDCHAGSRSSCFCPVCGDDFLDFELYKKHVKYYAKEDERENPVSEDSPKFSSHAQIVLPESGDSNSGHGDHEGANLASLFNPDHEMIEDETKQSPLSQIESHLRQQNIEIVVLVEGIEARSSNTFQARHSYTANDIVFDKFFAPCMEVAPNGHAQINLNHFHKTIPVPKFVTKSNPVQSRS